MTGSDDRSGSENGADRTGDGAALARLTLLARATEILASARVPEKALQRVARLTVPGFCTWCAVDLREDGGSTRRVALAGPATQRFCLDAHAPHGAETVMRTGEGELVPAVDDALLITAARGDPARLADLRALGLSAYLCVPLLAREGPVGALTLASTEHSYGPVDLELARELARRAAIAVENARLYRSLERSEERYRLLFEQSPLPMWVYDAETLAFLAVNAAAIRHYGYSREEFLGMTIRDIRPAEDIGALLDNISSRGAGSPVAATWRHRKRDGTTIDVEITAGRIVFEGRDASLVLAHDVSERKRLEERLTQAERMEAIGRLAGGVAHDFNNLLTVISGYTSMLLARAEQDELREIAHAAQQASSLTRQLLAFSRRQVMNPRILDLNEIIAGMESMLHRIIGDDVSVGVRLAPDLAPVEADRAQLERVVMNLAANARDAMPSGGRLTIETANVELGERYVEAHGEGAPGPHVALAVSDTGVGMSEETRRHLFEPFFTTKQPGAGTGLGLATVFGVVKQSGGSIYVYSEPGEGTTFKVYLPAAVRARSDASAAPAAEPAGERGNETILVVEDDESVRELVRLMLAGRGYDVLAVGGADEAERVCSERPGDVDLLLTDVVMPEMNGRALAERLAELEPVMRILFMSGYSDEAVYRHGVIRPNAAFIEKPFTERTLARKVREVLDMGG